MRQSPVDWVYNNEQNVRVTINGFLETRSRAKIMCAR